MSVEEWARRKLRSQVSGDRLYSQAFATNKEVGSRLRFTSVKAGTDEWRSRHRAAMLLGQAVTAGFWNWAAHTTRPLPAQVAIEYLATLSVLARWAAVSGRLTVMDARLRPRPIEGTTARPGCGRSVEVRLQTLPITTSR